MNTNNMSPETVKQFWRTKWSLFTGGNGSKQGYVTDISEIGCTLRTTETIEYRRWIRMLIRDQSSNVSFATVGRVIRCENVFEAACASEVTLYRYRVEFTVPVPLANMIVEAAMTTENSVAS